jgi:hypothetical protein
MGKWFCVWMFSDNRKINLNLEPKPAVVPERWRSVEAEITQKNILEKINFRHAEESEKQT